MYYYTFPFPGATTSACVISGVRKARRVDAPRQAAVSWCSSSTVSRRPRLKTISAHSVSTIRATPFLHLSIRLAIVDTLLWPLLVACTRSTPNRSALLLGSYLSSRHSHCQTSQLCRLLRHHYSYTIETTMTTTIYLLVQSTVTRYVSGWQARRPHQSSIVQRQERFITFGIQLNLLTHSLTAL